MQFVERSEKAGDEAPTLSRLRIAVTGHLGCQPQDTRESHHDEPQDGCPKPVTPGSRFNCAPRQGDERKRQSDVCAQAHGVNECCKRADRGACPQQPADARIGGECQQPRAAQQERESRQLRMTARAEVEVYRTESKHNAGDERRQHTVQAREVLPQHPDGDDSRYEADVVDGCDECRGVRQHVPGKQAIQRRVVSEADQVVVVVASRLTQSRGGAVNHPERHPFQVRLAEHIPEQEWKHRQRIQQSRQSQQPAARLERAHRHPVVCNGIHSKALTQCVSARHPLLLRRR